MRVRSLGLSPGQSQVVVDLLVMLTWSFVVVPSALLLLSPWRRLLPTERALTLMGIGLVMAVLTLAAEQWRRRGERAQAYLDQLRLGRLPLAPIAEYGEPDPMSPEQWAELKRIARQ